MLSDSRHKGMMVEVKTNENYTHARGVNRLQLPPEPTFFGTKHSEL